jgi:hypothetical protein
MKPIVHVCYHGDMLIEEMFVIVCKCYGLLRKRVLIEEMFAIVTVYC